jgi:hypothetical protein
MVYVTKLLMPRIVQRAMTGLMSNEFPNILKEMVMTVHEVLFQAEEKPKNLLAKTADFRAEIQVTNKS